MTTKQESMKICGARGFASLKVWGKENRKYSKEHKKNKRIELARCLDYEYDYYLKGHV